ncbi:MAG TPA: regulatory protein RecX [Alphaproteobacteria bacterium]|nr:regulatory protein RecX [Alphaproteobacteria bacterium]
MRRAAMRNAEWAADAETQKKLHTAIETIIEKYRKTGVLNDAAFAESKVHSLRRSGLSKRAIAQKLNAKGIPKNLIETSLDTSEDDGMDDTERDLKAARVFARKKRFGPYRAAGTDEDRHRKDIASMARAGFSFAIIKKVLGGEVPDEELF